MNEDQDKPREFIDSIPECDDIGIDHTWSTHVDSFCLHCGIGQFRALNLYRKWWKEKSEAYDEQAKRIEELTKQVEGLSKKDN